MVRISFLVFLSFFVVSVTSEASDLEKKLDAIQKQLSLLEKSVLSRSAPVSVQNLQNPPNQIPLRANRALAFQPMKRMVSWQPMKRSFEGNKQQVIRAIEEQLVEILRAGETLGVNSEDVLVDLKLRNTRM